MEARNLSESIKHYFETTSPEQIQKDWESTAHLDDCNSPTIGEFMKTINSQEKSLKLLSELETNNPDAIKESKDKAESFFNDKNMKQITEIEASKEWWEDLEDSVKSDMIQKHISKRLSLKGVYTMDIVFIFRKEVVDPWYRKNFRHAAALDEDGMFFHYNKKVIQNEP